MNFTVSLLSTSFFHSDKTIAIKCALHEYSVTGQHAGIDLDCMQYCRCRLSTDAGISVC